MCDFVALHTGQPSVRRTIMRHSSLWVASSLQSHSSAQNNRLHGGDLKAHCSNSSPAGRGRDFSCLVDDEFSSVGGFSAEQLAHSCSQFCRGGLWRVEEKSQVIGNIIIQILNNFLYRQRRHVFSDCPSTNLENARSEESKIRTVHVHMYCMVEKCYVLLRVPPPSMHCI